MSRLVKDRGSVGRRIWRRRKRKGPPQPLGAAAAEAGELAGDEDEPPAEEGAPTAPAAPAAAKKRGGLFAAMRALLAPSPADSAANEERARKKRERKAKASEPEPAYLVMDPTRDVLAVPRGAARLDAFERAIAETKHGTPQFRALALAYHRELAGLAEGAGVDLSLLEARVERCAQALIAAGEEERAGTLFLRVGRRHQAAEMFLQAGAVDALEETHAQIHWEEGGARHQARLELERFEALFLVGLRDQALEALTRAHSLWPENVIYTEMHARFIERLGRPRRLRLRARDHERVVVATWPLVIGRGEEAALVLQSPLLSRAHVQIERGAEGFVVRDLEGRGGTRVDGAPLSGAAALRVGAPIDMAGVVVETAPIEGGLALWAALSPQLRTFALAGARTAIPAPGAAGSEGVGLRFDPQGRALVEPPARLAGEAVRRATLVLEGDLISDGSWTWTVARS